MKERFKRIPKKIKAVYYYLMFRYCAKQRDICQEQSDFKQMYYWREKAMRYFYLYNKSK